ncbi:hypothetical protein CC80DRAFT_98763 [Byssothecium circinans]|uniref:BHLH domain-containing protein n=1 Tax=Byssothecium circinans TaxID=147558 RepID=A0A6A5UEU5_9PLEO|nr:hypothetical protein CC80DRAFT_98763 [Byssothecium circinans]
MEDKDPSPFGYTFSSGFLGGEPSGLDNTGQSLLSDTENQQLLDFFSMGWTDAPAYMPPPEHRDTADDFPWAFNVPPATIHSMSTTIPDQSQLHHGFPNDHSFAIPPANHNHHHMFNTQDDIQAASTLFHNAQMPQMNGRAYSFHGLPSSSTPMPSNTRDSPASATLNALPLVQTSNGFMNEQLAALLPNHDANGTIDAQLAAQFIASPARERHEAQQRELGLVRPHLKRTYTYGTDSSFNETGFQVSSKEETEEHVTNRLIHTLQHAEPLARPATIANGTKLQSPTGHMHFASSSANIPSDEEEQSEDGTENDDEDQHTRKRRKVKPPVKNGKRKSVSAASVKNRKASVDDRGSKKKRGSLAGQKAQRENLSDEQKRSNHILSEQKRRNLIKRGFDDLHDMVPEIRNGGLSKSGVLMEAGNFLDGLIDNNKLIQEMLGGGDG